MNDIRFVFELANLEYKSALSEAVIISEYEAYVPTVAEEDYFRCYNKSGLDPGKAVLSALNRIFGTGIAGMIVGFGVSAAGIAFADLTAKEPIDIVITRLIPIFGGLAGAAVGAIRALAKPKGKLAAYINLKCAIYALEKNMRNRNIDKQEVEKFRRKLYDMKQELPKVEQKIVEALNKLKEASGKSEKAKRTYEELNSYYQKAKNFR